MKKLLLLSFTLLIFSTLQAQSRLGYTANEIINEFSNQTFFNGQTNDGNPFIFFNTDDYVMAYYFNEQGQCYKCAQIVKNVKVEKLNKECVVISDRKWKLYHMNGGITNISLIYHDGFNVFIYEIGE